jgi:hypothetical protein
MLQYNVNSLRIGKGSFVVIYLIGVLIKRTCSSNRVLQLRACIIRVLDPAFAGPSKQGTFLANEKQYFIFYIASSLKLTWLHAYTVSTVLHLLSCCNSMDQTASCEASSDSLGFETRRLFIFFTTSHHWTLPWTWLVHILTSYFDKINFNIILPSTSSFPLLSMFFLCPFVTWHLGSKWLALDFSFGPPRTLL